MIKSLLFFFFLALHLTALSQTVTVNDLITITTLSDKKLSSYVSKLGFVPTTQNREDGTITNEFFYSNKQNPGDTNIRYLSGFRKGKITGSIYETSSLSEFQTVMKTVRSFGFTGGTATQDSLLGADSTRVDTVGFFQKEEMVIHANPEMRDDINMYRIQLEKKPVPSASSVRFAEDLFLFDSHESLVALFGAANVRRDIYFFSQSDSSRCSVLFPNSNRQAIFIWEDQPNDRTISFLMIGGGLRAESSTGFNQSLPLNSWRSASGLYTGMRLAEMIRLNEGDFEFFGKSSEFAFMVVPQKKGAIDFRKTGVTLGCLNCSNAPLANREKVGAEAAMGNGLQLHILSLILIPE
jgi:hypothetical protein